MATHPARPDPAPGSPRPRRKAPDVVRRARLCLVCLVLAGLALAAQGRCASEAPFPVAGRVTLVHFEASWCRPCRYLEQSLAAITPKYADRVAFVSVDFDRERELARSLDIGAVPTILVYDRTGGLAARHLGYLDQAALCRLLDGVLAGLPGQ